MAANPNKRGTSKTLRVIVMLDRSLPSMEEQFKLGRRAPLAQWLRGNEEITLDLRKVLADIVDGTIVPRARRGASGRISPTHALMIREYTARLVKEGYRRSVIIEKMATGFNVSTCTIRDVLAKRKTYAEK